MIILNSLNFYLKLFKNLIKFNNFLIFNKLGINYNLLN